MIICSCLQLFSQGKLAGEKVAKLKAKYTSLHERLKATREQESSLLHKAKEMHQEVQRQRVELEKGDSFPDGDNTEVNKLRQELLKHHNELAQADERQYQLEFKLEGLREEKMMLERDYSRMPKPGEIEKQVTELQKSVEELKVEIAQRTIDAKSLKEEVENRETQVNELRKEVEGDLEEQQKLRVGTAVSKDHPRNTMLTGAKMTPYLRIGNFQNHTLSHSTYLYSQWIRVCMQSTL